MFLDGMLNAYAMSLRSHNAFHKQDTDDWQCAVCLKNRSGMGEQMAQKQLRSMHCRLRFISFKKLVPTPFEWVEVLNQWNSWHELEFLCYIHVMYLIDLGQFFQNTYWLLQYCCLAPCGCVSCVPWVHQLLRIAYGKLDKTLHLDRQLRLHAAAALPSAIAVPVNKEKHYCG